MKEDVDYAIFIFLSGQGRNYSRQLEAIPFLGKRYHSYNISALVVMKLLCQFQPNFVIKTALLNPSLLNLPVVSPGNEDFS